MTRQKVFCIGLGKTGTTSLKEALRILGYRTVRLPLDWQGIDDFDAALPGVSAAMYPELDAAYPGSKFILTVREVEGWLKSIERDMRLKRGMDRQRAAEREKLLTMKYGQTTFERETFRKAFHEHEAKVRKHFKNRPDDLLVHNVTQSTGWEPLCEFLDLSVPDEPFPNVNKAQELDALLARLLFVTGEVETVVRIAKYSPASVERLRECFDLEHYDIDSPLVLKDDRRINKVLKRSSSYFGSPARAAKALNLPEEVIRQGIEQQRRHARTKLRPRRPLERLRRLIRPGPSRGG
ncbi:MAG: sulfotransferase [Chromatiaceae bacterium]|jgi:hypothetical protein